MRGIRIFPPGLWTWRATLVLTAFVLVVMAIVISGGVWGSQILGGPRTEHEAVVVRKEKSSVHYWTTFAIPEIDGYTATVQMDFKDWAPLKINDRFTVSIDSNGNYPKLVTHEK